MDTVVKEGNTKGQKYVLVAEDDSFYASVFKAKLSKEGHEVEVVENGELLLAAARKRMPDLIILDLIMPVKDGFETLKEIRADEKLKDIKVMIASNLGQEADMEKAKSLGISDYLVKTNSSVQEMVDRVNKALQ